ncbi:MAG: PQQ-binding-like beta-propeller repeat protein [Candidatus Bathyarchaeota archaeon]|nr:PQQ-binding-like beta-propeller repeat protein [Candidatus Bathyarchaeota archaeon]
MNPRSVFLTYLGWCPGAQAASKFVPDRNISLRVMAVSATILLTGLTVIAYFEINSHSLWIPEYKEVPIGELPVEWVRYFGRSDYDRGQSVLATRDGGYLIVGYDAVRNVTAWISESVYMLKTSSNGTLLWDNTYGDTGWDEGRSVIEAEDGYVITGFANEDILLMKTDSQGGVIWSKTYGKGSGFSVEGVGDGGYAIVGTSGDDVLLLRTDEDGVVLWSKTYGGSGKQLGRALQVLRDGGYLIGGITSSAPTSGDWDIYLLKTDPRGEVVWSKTLGGSQGKSLCAVLETYEGGVLAVGERGGGGSKTWVVKLDKDGEILWSNTYSGSVGFDAGKTGDGGYVILSQVHEDVLLMKIDGEGQLEWSKDYGGPFPDFGNSLQVTQDGGCVITGYQEVTALDQDILLIKVPCLEIETP